MQPMGPPTTFEIDDLYFPPADGLVHLERHNIAALFPDFQPKINQVRNQCELTVQVAKAVMKHYCEAVNLLHTWQRERQQLAQAMPSILIDLDTLAIVCQCLR